MAGFFIEETYCTSESSCTSGYSSSGENSDIGFRGRSFGKARFGEHGSGERIYSHSLSAAATVANKQAQADNASVVARLLASKLRASGPGQFGFERSVVTESPRAEAHRQAVHQVAPAAKRKARATLPADLHTHVVESSMQMPERCELLRAKQGEAQATRQEVQAMIRADREAHKVESWLKKREDKREYLKSLAAKVTSHSRSAQEAVLSVTGTCEHTDPAGHACDRLRMEDTAIPITAFRQMGLIGTHCSPGDVAFAAKLLRVTQADAKIFQASMDDWSEDDWSDWSASDADQLDETPRSAALNSAALDLLCAREKLGDLKEEVEFFCAVFGRDKEILALTDQLSKSWAGDLDEIWMTSDYLHAKRQRAEAAEEQAWARQVVKEFYGYDYF